MTPHQIALARSALGLPNSRNRSYRNTYVAPICPGPYDDWMRMVDNGDAERARVSHQGTMRFWLTPKGAKAALQEGERLCPEDFPK